MESLPHFCAPVNNHSRGPGRPPIRTPEREKRLIRHLVRAAVSDDELPDDGELGQLIGCCERIARQIRLDHGLNRHDLKRWMSKRALGPQGQDDEGLCYTPFAGLWLLVPLIVESALLSAAKLLKWATKTTVDAWQFVLTLLMWAVLGFRRFFHLEDFRHRADLGLALFTGRMRLLSDSTLWRLVHLLSPQSERAFYLATAAETIDAGDPDSAEVASFDDHTVPSLPPLGKTRVPTRGRSYPAFRLASIFDMLKGRFLGLLTRGPHERLSKVLLDLIAEVRSLKALAGHPTPNKLRIIYDRGGYRGDLFEKLMEDPDLTFLTMACCYAKSVRQWEAIPEEEFAPYTPPGEENSNLKITDSTTSIRGCRYPIRSIVIRDDTPETKQRWRVLFTNDMESTPADLDIEYRTRQHHEDAIGEVKHALAGDCLPKAYWLLREPNEQGERRHTVGTKTPKETTPETHLVAWVKHLGYNLVKDFGTALGEDYARMKVGTLVRKFIARPGVLRLKGRELWVTLEPFVGHQALAPWLEHINSQHYMIPWLDNLVLRVEVAQELSGHKPPALIRRRIFANSTQPAPT